MRWAEVDLDAIRSNAVRLCTRIPPEARLIAVVKADGYGHGARHAAGAALQGGAWGLAVSTLAEAREVADLVPPERLLALGGLAPAEAPEAVASGCQVTCSSLLLAHALEDAADTARPLGVHVKVDTGMGRFGASPEQAAELARFIAGSDRLRLAGVCTHFASSESDPAFTQRQFRLFGEVVASLGVDPGLRHASNSGAILRHPELALDAVRAGIALYGCEDSGAGLRPALALRATITHVKPVPPGATVGYGGTWRAERLSLVATATIGYADGVHRARSNRGEVLVRGHRVPLIGRVSMDAITLDVTAVPDVAIGDTATLIGRDGGEVIAAEEVAAWSNTISYEVLTSIGARVERRYQ